MSKKSEIFIRGKVLQDTAEHFKFMGETAPEINILEFHHVIDGAQDKGDCWIGKQIHDTREERDFHRMLCLKEVEFPGDFNIEEAKEFFAAQGWVIRSWPGGCRLWNASNPWPIRTGPQIARKRRMIQKRAADSRWHDYVAPDPHGIGKEQYNLAFDR